MVNKTTQGKLNKKPNNVKKQEIKGCWLLNYKIDLTFNDDLISITTVDGDDEPLRPTKVLFKMYLALFSNKEITIEVRFKIEDLPNVRIKDFEKENLKKQMIASVEQHWNNQFFLHATDQKKKYCNPRKLPVKFKVLFVDTNEHYKMNIIFGSGRAAVGGGVMTVYTDMKPWVFAHEFGHCLGLPDEYSDYPEDTKIQYYKPDGSLDSKIIGLPTGDDPRARVKTDPEASIMSVFGCNKVMERHGWFIAIMAKKIIDQYGAKQNLEYKFTISKS